MLFRKHYLQGGKQLTLDQQLLSLDEQSLSLNQKPLSLHQILEILEEEEEVSLSGVDIFISPPENAVGDLSDEDSEEEDNMDVNINNLPGSILRAPP